MQTLATLIQSTQVEVLGVTIVTGNQWRDEGGCAARCGCWRVMGRSDIPVVRARSSRWFARAKKRSLAGAVRQGWVCGRVGRRWYHDPFVVPPPKEGPPTAKPSTEDAAHFLIRMVHKIPARGSPSTKAAR